MHWNFTVHRFALFFILLVINTGLLFGGNTGKLAGRVTDAATGEPLVGATVLVEGTVLGAATDVDGNYVILNVPPGIYTVRASTVGYQPEVYQNVRVSIDLTTTIDFKLRQTVVELKEEVVVTAERPMVQRDLTASTAVVGADEIKMLPVTEFQQVLQLQAGVVGGHVRGGRSGELAYWIDGVPVTDVYNGSTVVDVNTNSIQEMQLVSGAFNAEYGQAMSGIVNITTRDGGNKFTGSITTYGGSYLTRHTDVFWGQDRFRPDDIRDVELSLSGPLVTDKLFFYTNIRYYYNRGYIYGIRKFNPWDISDNTLPNPSQWIIRATGDGAFVPMNPWAKAYAQTKLSWRITPTFQLSYNFILDNDIGKDYDFAFRLNPDGILSNWKKGYTNILTATKTLSSSTFFTAGLSYFFRDERRYLDYNAFTLEKMFARRDPFNQTYVHTKLLNAPEATFLTGGTNMFHGVRNTGTYLGKFDITSQMTLHHQVKAGLEVRLHKLYLHYINLQMSSVDRDRDPLRDGNPFVQIVIPSTETQDNQIYLHRPKEFSAYVQDKMEYKNIVVNFGVRFDWFDPDGVVLSDPSDPNIYVPINPYHIYKNYAPGMPDSLLIPTTLADRRAYWYKPASKKWQLSPRVGIAFPITDRGVIHFSYGLFFQVPPFERLYENPDFKLVLGGSTNLGIIGNADLRPEQTTNGEVGVQQQLTDDISVDVTGYFRDIRYLAGTLNEIIPVFGGTAIYSKYVNSDFGNVRGIVVSLDKKYSHNFTATLDYTFQIAKGNASDPAASFNMRNSGVLPETQLIPLDWDQRHTVNLTVSYSIPNNWGISLVGQYGSGGPYTPRATADVGAFIFNSGRKPATFNVDLNSYKMFSLGKFALTLFARIYNLFDTKNQYGVFDDTGLADFSLDYQHLMQTSPPQRVAPLIWWYTRPQYYSAPRRIEIGATVQF